MGDVKEYKTSKLKMGYKFTKMFFYRVIKRRWYLPTIPEITVDELLETTNSNEPLLIIDLRPEEEFNGKGESSYMTVYGHIPTAIRMGIMELSSHLMDLQSFMEKVTNLEDLQSFKEMEIITICPGGGMSLVGVEIMLEAGFTNVKSLKGGMELWKKKGYPLTTAEDVISPDEDVKPLDDNHQIIEVKETLDEKSMTEIDKRLDARGWLCPKPILNSRKILKKMKINQVLEIVTTDPGSKTDIPAWAEVTGQELISVEDLGPKEFRFLVRKLK